MECIRNCIRQAENTFDNFANQLLTLLHEGVKEFADLFNGIVNCFADIVSDFSSSRFNTVDNSSEKFPSFCYKRFDKLADLSYCVSESFKDSLAECCDKRNHCIGKTCSNSCTESLNCFSSSVNFFGRHIAKPLESTDNHVYRNCESKSRNSNEIKRNSELQKSGSRCYHARCESSCRSCY